MSADGSKKKKKRDGASGSSAPSSSVRGVGSFDFSLLLRLGASIRQLSAKASWIQAPISLRNFVLLMPALLPVLLLLLDNMAGGSAERRMPPPQRSYDPNADFAFRRAEERAAAYTPPEQRRSTFIHTPKREEEWTENDLVAEVLKENKPEQPKEEEWTEDDLVAEVLKDMGNKPEQPKEKEWTEDDLVAEVLKEMKNKPKNQNTYDDDDDNDDDDDDDADVDAANFSLNDDDDDDDDDDGPEPKKMFDEGWELFVPIVKRVQRPDFSWAELFRDEKHKIKEVQRLWLKAAEMGFDKAQYNLGFMNDYGHAMKKPDKDLARECKITAPIIPSLCLLLNLFLISNNLKQRPLRSLRSLLSLAEQQTTRKRRRRGTATRRRISAPYTTTATA